MRFSKLHLRVFRKSFHHFVFLRSLKYTITAVATAAATNRMIITRIGAASPVDGDVSLPVPVSSPVWDPAVLLLLLVPDVEDTDVF